MSVDQCAYHHVPKAVGNNEQLGGQQETYCGPKAFNEDNRHDGVGDKKPYEPKKIAGARDRVEDEAVDAGVFADGLEDVRLDALRRGLLNAETGEEVEDKDEGHEAEHQFSGSVMMTAVGDER